MAEAGGDHAVHMEAQEDPEGTWVNDPSPNSKGRHGNPGYWPAGIAMEGGGGNHLHPPEGKCTPPQLPSWVSHREGNGDRNPRTESGAGAS